MKNKYKYLLFSFLISFTILLFTSKNSFLYPLNDWVDANAFFTMGKSLFRGIIPYRDLFEQKGLILYIIYGIGSLISYKSFTGVFLLEVIGYSTFLYYCYKITSLFLEEKRSLIILPLLGMIMTTSRAFSHGGGCEELCLPFMCISLYYFIKHFKVSNISNKETIIVGIMAGLVLMMKYTLLGLFIGIGLFIVVDYLRKKDYKKILIFCLYYLLGMFIVIVPCIVYLLINHALKDFINCYFIINITSYGSVKINIITKIYKLIEGFFKTVTSNGIIISILMILYPLFIINIKSDKYFKTSMIGLYLVSIFFIFYGLIFYRYYLFALLMFILLSLISIVLFIENKIIKKNEKVFNIISIFIIIISIFFSYYNSNYKYMLFDKKENYFQYKFSDYINKYSNPTLLNMGYLDSGVYTTSGIIPNTKFFEVQNIDYDRFPDNLDDMKNNVINKNIMFIVYYTMNDYEYIKENDGYIFDNYELIMNEDYYYEGHNFKAFLFQLKDTL